MAAGPSPAFLHNMSSEFLDREFLDDDPMPLGTIPELDENVINNSLINLSSEAFTLSQPDAGNHNIIIVEPVNQVSKNPVSIGQILHPSFPEIIKNISKSNFSRVDVGSYDGKGTNKIVESNKALTNYNLKAFIPNYRVSREGIIRDIPFEIEIDDIVRHALTNLKCPSHSHHHLHLKEDWNSPR